jgi:hypothetical protein
MILLYEEREDQLLLNMETNHFRLDLPVNQADHHKGVINNIGRLINQPFLKENLISNNKNQHFSSIINHQPHRLLFMLPLECKK